MKGAQTRWPGKQTGTQVISIHWAWAPALGSLYGVITERLRYSPHSTRTRRLSLRHKRQNAPGLPIFNSLLFVHLLHPSQGIRFAPFSTLYFGTPWPILCVSPFRSLFHPTTLPPFSNSSASVAFHSPFSLLTGPSFYSGSNLLRRHSDTRPPTLIQLH